MAWQRGQSGNPSGKPKGPPGPSSEKRIAANRRNPLKHGRDTKALTPVEVKDALLRKIHRDAPEMIAGVFEIAARGGEIDAFSRQAAKGLFETELLRRQAVDAIVEDGVVVEDHAYDKDGNVAGIRKKAHPLLEHVGKMSEQLGYTAEAQQMTRKSRGEGEKDAAVTALLNRRALLRSADKGRMLPPGGVIDSEVVL